LVHSDGFPLASNARSRVAGGFFFLSDHPGDMTELPIKTLPQTAPFTLMPASLNIKAVSAAGEIAATSAEWPVRPSLTDQPQSKWATRHPSAMVDTTLVSANDTIRQKRV
jgi:hypothetical protein